MEKIIVLDIFILIFLGERLTEKFSVKTFILNIFILVIPSPR